MVETIVPRSACPECGHEMDRATGAFSERARPQPGDISVCINCGTVLIFAVVGMQLRKAEPREIVRLHPKTRHQIDAVQAAIVRLRGAH